MLWLAIHIPALPLQVFTRGLADPDVSIGVIDTRRRTRILLANEAAHALGVFDGQAVSAAHALAPRLQLQPRQTALETALLAEIACWAGRFTPRISLAPPDAVLLEIGPSLRLFGGMDAIRQHVQDGLADLGIRARIACAPTPLAASGFARCGQAPAAGCDWQAALDALPVSALDRADTSLTNTLELLEGLGADTLAAVRALPPAGLARRQAELITRLIAQARGELPDPRPWFTPPPRFVHELVLPAPTHHSEALLFAARRLFASLAAWLQARHAAIDHCRLILVHERAGTSTLDIVLGHPSNDESHLALIVRERLATHALPGEVCALRLEAEHPQHQAPRAADLFGTPGQTPGETLRLLDRLQARLGKDAIHRLCPISDHRPECAWQAHGSDAPPAGTPTRAPQNSERPRQNRRPFWLLPEPKAISPQQLTLIGDAERIESGWWDGSDIRRDYYLARRSDHSLCWVFHTLEPPGGWYLQGYFG